jgi:hypothetical protein
MWDLKHFESGVLLIPNEDVAKVDNCELFPFKAAST